MRYALPLLLLVLVPAGAQARVWTNTEGKTLTAEFVSATSTIVTLKAADGKVHDYPVKKLSQADQGAVIMERLRRLEQMYAKAHSTGNQFAVKKALAEMKRELKKVSGTKLVLALPVGTVTEHHVTLGHTWSRAAGGKAICLTLYQRPTRSQRPNVPGGSVQLRPVTSSVELYRLCKCGPTIPIGKDGMPTDRAATLSRGAPCLVECTVDYCAIAFHGWECLTALVLKDIKLK